MGSGHRGRLGWAGQESRPREPASHLDLTTHCDIAASDVLCVSNVPYSTAARRHIYATAAAGSSSDEKTAGTKQHKTRLKRIITILALNSQEVEECMLAYVCAIKRSITCSVQRSFSFFLQTHQR